MSTRLKVLALCSLSVSGLFVTAAAFVPLVSAVVSAMSAVDKPRTTVNPLEIVNFYIGLLQLSMMILLPAAVIIGMSIVRLLSGSMRLGCSIICAEFVAMGAALVGAMNYWTDGRYLLAAFCGLALVASLSGLLLLATSEMP
jgi:hypothetical protein